jgi:hypothetical protein
MDLLKIRTSHIRVPPRMRPLNDAAVERLMQSILAIGLRQPISVRLAQSETETIDGEKVRGVPVVVAGFHRLEAVKRLGWSHIDCIGVDDGPMLAELWEIDENLMRNELSAAEKARHLKRRQAIWSSLHEGGTTRPTPGGPQRVQFASATVDATGLSKRDVNRSLSRAEELGPDLDRIAGTSLDKGVELDALAKLAPEERAPIIDRAAAGEVVSARSLSDYSISIDARYDREWNRLRGDWNRACQDVRRDFAKAVAAANTGDGFAGIE